MKLPARRRADKGIMSKERRLKISISRKNSPKVKAWVERCRRIRELKEHVRLQVRLQEKQRNWEMWGGYKMSPEARANISQANKGRIPWNRGIKAWNNGLEWPDNVKENISQGMIAYWIQRKEQRQLLQQSTNILDA